MNLVNNAIGVFDSGLGGLTAVKELKNVLPFEDIIYFGDTGRVPYGTHSFETINKYAIEDMKFLLKFDIKAVLVACGTVSAIALPNLLNNFDLPIVGVIEPAVKKACTLTKNHCIAILGTPATTKNGSYEKQIKKINPDISVVPIACPMFVPLVENNYIDRQNKVTKMIATEYLSELIPYSPDVLILGCTHYPIIKDIIFDVAKEILGEIQIVEAGACAASALKELLDSSKLNNTKKTNGVCKYFVSDETHNFESTANLFLGEKVNNITKIELECIY